MAVEQPHAEPAGATGETAAPEPGAAASATATASATGPDAAVAPAPAAAGCDADAGAAACCPRYHEAIEFLGKRWTGAIVRVLMHRSPRRFSEIAHAVPELSDRLLSERMKELEARGVVARTVVPGRATRVEYALTPMGRELEPALSALEAWAQRWLDAR